MSVNQAGGFVRSRDGLDRPNLQLYFSPLSYTRAQPGVRKLLSPDPFPGFLLSAQPCRPDSRGRIRLRSVDPLDAPRHRAQLAGVASAMSMRSWKARSSCADWRARRRLRSVIAQEMAPGPEVVTRRRPDRGHPRPRFERLPSGGHLPHGAGSARRGGRCAPARARPRGAAHRRCVGLPGDHVGQYQYAGAHGGRARRAVHPGRCGMRHRPPTRDAGRALARDALPLARRRPALRASSRRAPRGRPDRRSASDFRHARIAWRARDRARTRSMRPHRSQSARSCRRAAPAPCTNPMATARNISIQRAVRKRKRAARMRSSSCVAASWRWVRHAANTDIATCTTMPARNAELSSTVSTITSLPSTPSNGSMSGIRIKALEEHHRGNELGPAPPSLDRRVVLVAGHVDHRERHHGAEAHERVHEVAHQHGGRLPAEQQDPHERRDAYRDERGERLGRASWTDGIHECAQYLPARHGLSSARGHVASRYGRQLR